MALSRTLREIIRYLITRTGMTGVYLRWRKAMGQQVNYLDHARVQDRFSTIYENAVWRNGRAFGSLSGAGSDLESTGTIRAQLPSLLESLGTRVLLDIGCGDFNWMKELALDTDYIGADIVESVIKTNISKYQTKNRTFLVLDAIHDSLPASDTVLCREVLFHLSIDDIWRVIENIRLSGTQYLIATSDSDIRFNSDIISGDFRLLNLHRPPFHFPKAEAQIQDASISAARTLSVWKIVNLPEKP